MLKTKRGDEYWLVTQPDHGTLAGELAAHWGNREFARPGEYGHSANPEQLRNEVELAIAEHDNGWWEWEADPSLSPEDGLPQGLQEVLKDPVQGMDRWRLGISRLAQHHPYVSLLISNHAYWLYAAQFDATMPVEFTHQLQRNRRAYPREIEDTARRFLDEVRGLQKDLLSRMERPEQVEPHTRLLQTLDSVSLALCSNVIVPVHGEARGFGEDHVVYEQVPRKSWDDRVTIEVRPVGQHRLKVAPYPFSADPLEVSIPVRVAQAHQPWRRAPWMLLRYELSA